MASDLNWSKAFVRELVNIVLQIYFTGGPVGFQTQFMVIFPVLMFSQSR